MVYADLLFLKTYCQLFYPEVDQCDVGLPWHWRILLSSSAGSLCCICCDLLVNPLIADACQILFSMLMVPISFRVKSAADFLRRWGIMLLVAFMLGGCTYAFQHIGRSTPTYGGLMLASSGAESLYCSWALHTCPANRQDTVR